MVFFSKPLPGIGLQCGKPENLFLVLIDYKIDTRIAKITNAVKKYNGFILHGTKVCWLAKLERLLLSGVSKVIRAF